MRDLLLLAALLQGFHGSAYAQPSAVPSGAAVPAPAAPSAAPAGIAALRAGPLIPGLNTPLSPGASPWTGVVERLLDSPVPVLYHLDLVPAKTQAAFIRVLARTALQPEKAASAGSDKDLTIMVRSAMLKRLDALHARMLKAKDAPPAAEQAAWFTADAAEIEDLAAIAPYFSESTQERIAECGKIMQEKVLPNLEDLEAFRQGKAFFKGRGGDGEAEGTGVAGFFRGALRRLGLARAPAEGSPSEREVPAPGKGQRHFFDELRARLDAVKIAADLKACHSAYVHVHWSPPLKEELRAYFLASPSPRVRAFLLSRMAKDFEFGSLNELLVWLYPEYAGELADIFPEHKRTAPRGADLDDSPFSDPELVRGWAESVRALKAGSPEHYKRLAGSGDGTTILRSGALVYEAPAGSSFGTDYRLPYKLEGAEAKVRGGTSARLMTARLRLPDPERGIKKRYGLFDRLIEANFQVLQSMSALAGGATRGAAKGILAQTRRMVQHYDLLVSGDATEGSAHSAYARIKRGLQRSWRALGDDEALPEPVKEKLFALDADEPRGALHSFINWMHQKALAAMSADGFKKDEGAGWLDKGENSLRFVYLGDAPLHETLRGNAALKALWKSLDRIEGIDRDSAFVSEDRLWLHSRLGVHSAELFADVSDPDEGGMLRVRYKESGYQGSYLRLKVIVSFFESLGLPAHVDGHDFLTVSWDKDHGLASRRELVDVYPLVVRFIHDLTDLDLVFENVERQEGQEEAEDIARRMGAIYAAEGGWPFEIEDMGKIFDGLQAYDEREGKRAVLKARLNAELARLGLPYMPADLPLGQIAIDRWFTRPIEEAAARGELVWDGFSTPQKAAYAPLETLVTAALTDPKGSAALAGVLAGLEDGALSYEPVGRVGALRAERTALRLDDGSILSVHLLREPSSGRPAYAAAALWRPVNGKKGKGLLLDLFAGDPAHRTLDADKLVALLRGAGFAAEPGEPLSPRQTARLLELLVAPLSAPSGALSEISGLPASPGEGDFSTGPLVFDKASRAEGGVLAAPYTSPDDMEAIGRSAGVLTTGGGSLSHAAITTRELGTPSVILHSARWQKDADGKPTLRLPLTVPGAPFVMGGRIQGLRLEPAGDPTLREGDLVRMHGKTGAVELLERGPDGPLHRAHAALERLRSGAASALEWEATWDAAVERFLLEEARSNARYRSLRSEIRGALILHSMALPMTETLSSERPAYVPVPRPRRPLWSRLQERLKRGGDTEKSMALLRRMLRRNGATAEGAFDLLFVCTGNTCRSPMAEQIAKSVLESEGVPEVRVRSRGFMSPYPGEKLRDDEMTPEARAALEKLGIAGEPHTVRGLSSEDVRGSDLILVMEEGHRREIVREHPDAADKVFLFKDFAGLGAKPIEDPMFLPRLPFDLDGGRTFGVDPERAIQAIWDRAAHPGDDGSAYERAAREILKAARGALRQLKSFAHLRGLYLQAREERVADVRRRRPAVLALGEIDDELKGFVGGKSAKLGEMLQALRGTDASVPDGAALTYFAYERFLEESGLKEKVAALAAEIDALDSSDPARLSEEVARLSVFMRGTLLKGKLDPQAGVGAEILAALAQRGLDAEGVRLAVRSSAIQEDTDDAAFAGAAESYLHVPPEEVLAKVVESWASFWLPRGVLYRRQHGLRSADLQPATLIQKMTPAEVSGVVFTRDPVTGESRVVINAAYGLGEGVVSGQTPADVYTTSKLDGQEVELPHVARKRWRIEPMPEGSGTRLGPVPRELRARRALTPAQTAALTRVAVALEKQFGKAMDIEYTVYQGRIVILQARPITTR